MRCGLIQTVVPIRIMTLHPIDKRLIEDLERIDTATERLQERHAGKPAWYRRVYTERRLKKLREKILNARRAHASETEELLLKSLADALEPSYPSAARTVRRL